MQVYLMDAELGVTPMCWGRSGVGQQWVGPGQPPLEAVAQQPPVFTSCSFSSHQYVRTLRDDDAN